MKTVIGQGIQPFYEKEQIKLYFNNTQLLDTQADVIHIFYKNLDSQKVAVYGEYLVCLLFQYTDNKEFTHYYVETLRHKFSTIIICDKLSGENESAETDGRNIRTSLRFKPVVLCNPKDKVTWIVETSGEIKAVNYKVHAEQEPDMGDYGKIKSEITYKKAQTDEKEQSDNPEPYSGDLDSDRNGKEDKKPDKLQPEDENKTEFIGSDEVKVRRVNTSENLPVTALLEMDAESLDTLDQQQPENSEDPPDQEKGQDDDQVIEVSLGDSEPAEKSDNP